MRSKATGTRSTGGKKPRKIAESSVVDELYVKRPKNSSGWERPTTTDVIARRSLIACYEEMTTV